MQKKFPVLFRWTPEAVGGPTAAESHSCAGPLPGQRCPPSAEQEPYPALYPTTLLRPEKQPLTGKNFASTPNGGGREGRRGEKTPWKLGGSRNRKGVTEP